MRGLLAVAALLVVAGAAAPATAAPAPDPCPRSSWAAGTVELCAGTLVYRDYVYDDYGAFDPVRTRTAPATGTLSRPAGAERYPAGEESTADLVALRLRIDGDELEATFVLNTVQRGGQAIAALAIDTDDDAATGGGAWESLGVRSDGWEVLAVFDEGDPASDTVTGRLPLPDGARWRVQAVTARDDGTVMNVAFRGTDEQTAVGAWFEDNQAAALADGDISGFGHRVDVAELHAGVTRSAPAVTGYHSRVYVSDHTLGEGMTYEPVHGRNGDTGEVCEQAFHMLGPYQPYGIYVPDQDGPHGVQLALHGCGANHSSLVDQPGMQQRFGDELNRIVVVPLGRGPVGYYSDISERDVLDVLADVHATFDTDADAVFSGGYSMGGYGALRLAMLYPDLFAGLVDWVGFTGDGWNNPSGQRPAEYRSGAVGNVIDLVRNLRHVPSALLYGGADELVHAHTAWALERQLAGHDVVYEFFFHPYAEHFTFAVADDWGKEAAYSAGLRRVVDPPRVTYRTDPSLAFPEYDLHHDRAYWVSAIAGRDEGYVDVDVTSLGCGGDLPVYEQGQDAGVGPAAFAWASTARTVAGTEPFQAERRLEATLANVSKLAVDVAATCLDGEAIGYRIDTDGPTTLRFSDGRTLALADAGTHEGVVEAAGGPPAAQTGRENAPVAAPVVAPPALPATGPALPSAGGVVLLGLLAMVTARARAGRRARR